MPEGSWTKLEVDEAIMSGAETCPDCKVGWTEPLDEDGKVIPDAGNLVLLHKTTCAGYVEPNEPA